jgi:hypothetical protein
VFINIYRTVFYRGGRWIFAEVVVVFQIVFWPDRTWAEATAAIAADVLKYFFNTLLAKSTFISANHGFR